MYLVIKFSINNFFEIFFFIIISENIKISMLQKERAIY